MESKRGQFNLYGIIAFLVIIAIIVGLIVWNTQFRYVLIGIGLVIASFFILFKADVKQKVKTPLFLVIMGIGLVLIFSSGFLQSITAVSTYQDSDGNSHWLISGVTDNVDEGFIFRSLPSKTIVGNTEITPKEEAVLFVSKKDSYCDYEMQRVPKTLTIKVLFIPVKTLDVGYYQLISPERVALITVKDDSGTSYDMDGTLKQTKIFYDNGGKLEFKTLGVISGKRDCESASNLALVNDGTAWKLYDRADYNSKVGEKQSVNFGVGIDIFNIADLIKKLNVKVLENTQFVSGFKTYDIQGTDNFRGFLDIGSVSFTIDADQKYYNSFVYVKPKAVIPSVDLVTQDKVNQDGSYSAKAIITNRESSSGNIVVKATLDSGSVSGSTNVVLKDRVELPFIIKAPNKVTDINLCVEACSTESPISCDKECKKTQVVAKEVVITDKCGDKLCQSSESITSCPSDCKLVTNLTDDTLVCDKWYQEKGIKTDYKYNLLFFKFGKVETEVCKVQSWIPLTLVIIVIGSLGAFALYLTKPRRRRK